MVDHNVLLNRLYSSFGICGTALSWICSYISVAHSVSMLWSVLIYIYKLFQWVPQGSVLGPFLFSAYISPIPEVVVRWTTGFLCSSTLMMLNLRVHGRPECSARRSECL